MTHTASEQKATGWSTKGYLQGIGPASPNVGPVITFQTKLKIETIKYVHLLKLKKNEKKVNEILCSLCTRP